MAISVLGLPANFRAPGTYISNTPNTGGSTIGAQNTMVIGQMLSSGVAVPNIPIQVFSRSDFVTQFGGESMLTQMLEAYRQNDVSGPLWVCPLADAAGTAASLTLTIAGTPTAGALTVYINNFICQTATSIADTPTTIAANVAASINAMAANPNFALGATAAAVGPVVTITSAHLGLTAGDLQVKINKYGPSNGEVLSGITVTVSALTPGTVDPVLTTALSNIASLPWLYLVCPYTTAVANAAVSTLLNDATGRWSPLVQLYGDRFAAVRGTLGAMTTYSAANSANKHMSTLGILDSQTPAYVAAAIYGGLAAQTSRSNVALPIVGVLQGLDAPSPAAQTSRSVENTLLFSGISTVRVNGSGQAVLSRAVQEYVTDSDYLNVETDMILASVDQYIRNDLESVYAQCSLLADGNPVAAGSGATTPSLVLQHVWGLYLMMEQFGWVQNSKQFIAQSYVEAQLSLGIVSMFLPVQTAGFLRVIRISNSFS